MGKLPSHFVKLTEKYGDMMEALKKLGDAAKDAGPLDEKTAHLIQIAASGAMRLEGAVHSHTRRALAAGCTPDEIRHSLVLLTPTIGFPAVSAALSWVEDVLKG